MKLFNQPQSNYDPAGSRAPWLWYGPVAVDGAAQPFCDAPQGSLYWYQSATGVTLYYRNAMNNATADWNAIFGNTGGTISGDVLVVGTVTAGDFVASAG